MSTVKYTECHLQNYRMVAVHCEPKETHQNVLPYLLQNQADFDKIWYMLS